MILSNLDVKIGDNQIGIEGNFTLDEVRPLVAEWFHAIPGGLDQSQLDALVLRLKTQNDGLALAVSNAHPGITAG